LKLLALGGEAEVDQIGILLEPYIVNISELQTERKRGGSLVALPQVAAFI